VNAPVSPAIARELDELRAWQPLTYEVPSLLSPLTLVLGLLLAGAGVAIAATHKTDQVLSVSFSIPAFILIPLFLWSLGRRDLSVLRVRHRETPQDAVTYYFNRVARRLYGRARSALPDYASAVSRHASLQEKIRKGGKPEVHDVAIRKVTPMGNEFAAIELDILMRETSTWIIPLPGHLMVRHSNQDHVRSVTKMVVHRNDRWYVICGLLEDRVDRALLRALEGNSPH
jgi:hypothetical protein